MKIYQNRVNISIKERFLSKFIFCQNFLFEKRKEIVTKQSFTYISKQNKENLITPSGVGYLVTSKKILGSYKSFLKIQEQKFRNFSKF